MRSGKTLFPDKKGKSPQPLFEKEGSIEAPPKAILDLSSVAPLNRKADSDGS
jgi:hypothetical protein